jgi:sterol desaturase/sphingolipid hydroxylase (fatty acid hydroxylase superfamily)
MGAAVGASWWLMQRGLEPAVAILGPQMAAIFVVVVCEHIYPHHQTWNVSRGDLSVDARHALVIFILSGSITPLLVSLGVAAGGWLSDRVGMGLWPSDWPLPAQIFLAMVIGELPGYWIHRWQHERDWLWRFHAVHHSAPRLYWLNAARFHPVDYLMTYIPSYLLLVVIGGGEVILAYFAMITVVHGIFQHANLQLRLGPLNWIFSMAELHRWHHSRTVFEANHNYGQTISIWDWLLGTRYLPADRAPPEDIGIADLQAFPMSWWAQVLSPFRWAGIKRESRLGAAR